MVRVEYFLRSSMLMWVHFLDTAILRYFRLSPNWSTFSKIKLLRQPATMHRSVFMPCDWVKSLPTYSLHYNTIHWTFIWAPCHRSQRHKKRNKKYKQHVQQNVKTDVLKRFPWKQAVCEMIYKEDGSAFQSFGAAEKKLLSAADWYSLCENLGTARSVVSMDDRNPERALV